MYRHDHSQMILGTARTAAEAALMVAKHRALSSARGAAEALVAVREDENESAERMAQHASEQTPDDCRRKAQGD